MADQGDRPVSRSSHKKTGKSGKQPAGSRVSQDTLGFPHLTPIVSMPPLRDEVVEPTSSSSEEDFIVTDTPPITQEPTAGSGSTSGRPQPQPQQQQQHESGQQQSGHQQSGHHQSHQSGEQQSQTLTIQTGARTLIRPDGNG